MRSHLKGNDNLSSYLTKRTSRAGGGRAAVGVAGARAQPRRFPARIGCASSLRAWAPRPLEAGASPSPPCRQGRVRPDRGWSRTGASASVRVAGSLGHRSWKRGCALLPAPPEKGPSPGWISDPHLGSRPACRAGSISGHDELLVRSGSGSAGCPSRPVTEGHVPPARGLDSICQQEAASDGGAPTLPVFWEAIFKGCASYPGPSQTLDAIRWQPPWCKM